MSIRGRGIVAALLAATMVGTAPKYLESHVRDPSAPGGTTGPGLLRLSTKDGEARKARAYLKEVKKHLLESFIERERMEEKALVRAGIRAMAAAMDHKDFSGVEAEKRAAVKAGLKGLDSLDAAVAAVEEKVPDLDFLKLADHGAQAMVRETGDPFSRILTQEDLAGLLKMLQGGGREESIGCSVQMKEGKVAVAYVQYGYAAYEEGIEIGDEVLKVAGRKAEAVRPEEWSELLKVRAGETLELGIRRDGRDYDFKIAHRKAMVKDVRHQYLGQGVGYLRLTIFDGALVKEARSALQKMQKEGMKAILLDLRHNPGGALPASTGVADLFLPQGLLITKTVSHYKPSLGGLQIPGFGGDMDFKTTARSEFEQMPMVCLVNRASASASELLAGALKDHGRATLIGETTYGKGVGQTPIFLTSMMMKRYLYLTVMRYTTPKGNEVNHIGVAPGIACAEDRPSAERFADLWSFRASGLADTYVAARWGDELRGLAEYDGFESDRWPGFEAFFAGLKTGLSKDDVRGELRRAARRKMADEGTVWVADLQTDRVLQRGLVELVDALEKKQ